MLQPDELQEQRIAAPQVSRSSPLVVWGVFVGSALLSIATFAIATRWSGGATATFVAVGICFALFAVIALISGIHRMLTHPALGRGDPYGGSAKQARTIEIHPDRIWRIDWSKHREETAHYAGELPGWDDGEHVYLLHERDIGFAIIGRKGPVFDAVSPDPPSVTISWLYPSVLSIRFTGDWNAIEGTVRPEQVSSRRYLLNDAEELEALLRDRVLDIL